MPKTTVSRPSVKPRATPQKTTTKRTRKQLTSGPTHSRHVKPLATRISTASSASCMRIGAACAG